MTEMPTASVFSLHRQHQPQRSISLRRFASGLAGTVAIALSLWAGPALADPFRSGDARMVDQQTEAAFKAMFEQGNYQEARQLLENNNTSEPLAYAIRASLGYLERDWNQLGENATRTREAAERLLQTDPLRGHLYIAAGHFLEGAHLISTQETVRATPAVLGKLRQVFDNMGAAERIDPTDPELNLLKGFMDLMLAVNLPFSNPADAIARLENSAAPSYLAQRGIAIGYRDLDRQDLAMQAVERALETTPDNPDLLYLKAQILVRQNREEESLRFFRLARRSEDQLPRRLANQIAWEQCRTSNRVNSTERNCGRLLNR